ncbi:MAG: 50S ribosomal protein L31 [Mycoplasmoidaceae bacterium]
MKKDIHPQSQLVKFSCTSCNAEYAFLSTISNPKTSIDVCAKCHPFYIGNLSAQQVRGRAEKLSKKFEVGKTQISTDHNKDKKDSKKAKKKIIHSLDSL